MLSLSATAPVKKSDDKASISSTLVVNGKKVDKDPVYFVDGKRVDDIKDLDPEKIESITVKKDSEQYPDGVIYIELKK